MLLLCREPPDDPAAWVLVRELDAPHRQGVLPWRVLEYI